MKQDISVMLITYEMAQQKLKEDSADKKILELLSATKGFQIDSLTSLSAKQLLGVADRLEITEASVRMSLSRQTKQGKLIRENANYSLTSSKQPFILPRFWLDLTQRCGPWKNDWFLVNLGHQKFKPTIMRRLQRKADLLGLKFIPSLGWIRPNNLTDLNSEVTFHFGLVTGTEHLLTTTMHGLSANWQTEFAQLWKTDEMNLCYQHNLAFIKQEQKLLDELDSQDILVRSFAVGRLIVEYLANDPWLPDNMIDYHSRNQIVEEAMKYYQKIMPDWLSALN